MPKQLLVSTLAAGLLALSAQAQSFVGTDNFDSNVMGANWAIGDFTVNGALTAANGRVEMSVGDNTGTEAGWHWNPLTTPTSWTTSWQATVTVSDTWAGGNNNATTRGYIEIYDPGTSQPFPTLNISLRANTDGSGNLSYLVRALDTYGTGSTPNVLADAATNNNSAQLRLTFDANTKVATASYSFDSGATFTDLESVDLDSGANAWPPAALSSLATNGFGLNIWGYSVGADLVQGQVAFDNFSITAVPEPAAWAAIIGAVGLAGAIWRRRRATA